VPIEKSNTIRRYLFFANRYCHTIMKCYQTPFHYSCKIHVVRRIEKAIYYMFFMSLVYQHIIYMELKTMWDTCDEDQPLLDDV
ncbi:hypothetical protein ACJX0J_036469, partial [Zea mays]